MIPAPIPADDEERLATLHALDLLDSPPEERYDRVTQLARELFDVPIALISLVDKDRQWFKSNQGLEASQTPRDVSFCGHTIVKEGPMIVPDASADPRFNDNPLVSGAPGIRFYAGAPLAAPDGRKIGTLCLIDRKPRALTADQVRLLMKLAQLIEEQIVLGTALRRSGLEGERERLLAELKGSSRGLRRRAAGAFVAAALLLISVTTFAFSVMRELGGDIDAVAMTRESLSSVGDMMVSVQAIETGARGYALTGQKRYLDAYAAGRLELRSALAALREVSGDEEGLTLEFNKARVYAERSAAISEGIVTTRRTLGLQAAVAEVGKSRNFTSLDTLRHLSRSLDAAINERLHERTERLTRRAVKLGTILAVSCLLAVFLLGWSLWEVDRNSEARILAQAEAARAAAELQAVFDSATAVAIIATRPDGRIRVFNHGAETMLGYSAHEMVGVASPLVIHDPAEVAARAQELGQALGRKVDGFAVFTEAARAGVSDEREWTYIRKDGTRFPVNLIVTAIRDDEKQVIGYLGFATDITVKNQIRDELARARDMALKAAEMKSQFLANMSHEIRTPLNAIIGMASLLFDEALDPRHRKFVGIIRQAGDGLLAVLNDVLDYSKIEAGMLRLESVPFDLRAELENAVAIVMERARSKGLAVAVSVAPDVPPALKGDPMRLRQVLLNLLSNAIKFTQMGQVLLEAKVTGGGGPRAVVRISVRDTGIGISPEAQGRLFQSFSQADNSTSRRFGGTGLGLAISKQLVELAGGRIGVESVEGKGSEFWLEIPFETISGAPTKAAPSGLLRGLRVLVVDDVPVNRDILVDQFIAWGMAPETADSGPAALETLRRAAGEGRPFGLAMLDLQMPGMDGLALARCIQADPTLSRVRSVLVTSSGQTPPPSALKENGLHECLVKPVQQAALLDCVNRVVSPARTPTEPAAPAPQNLKRHFRIMLVDDNETNRMVSLLLLERLGYTADVAVNAAQALELLSARAYDLVFMDCQMPGMDGYEATRVIRRRDREWPRRPIVTAMTAGALQDDRDRCVAAGMDDYISKPIKNETLSVVLERWDVPLRPEILEEVRRLSGAQYPHLLKEFAENMRRYHQELSRAAGAGAAEDLRQAAHTLRGSSGSVGAYGVENLCALIEDAARRGGSEDLPALLRELSDECARVDRALESA